MEIIVLIKEVPDLNVWVEIEPKTYRVDPDDLVYMANPRDLAALYLAIRLRESLENGSVTALLLGSRQAGKTLRKCLDYGANCAIHVIWEGGSKLESHQIALTLVEAIRRIDLGYDLIFCSHDPFGSNLASGHIGSQIATHLGLPYVSQVNCIKPGQDHMDLIVGCLLDLGDRVTLKCRPPMLIVAHPDAEPASYPSFDVSLDALDIGVQQVDLRDLNLDPSRIKRRTRLLNVSSARPRPKKMFTPESNLPAAERIRLVMEGGLKKKGSDYIRGSPQELAVYITEFLLQKKIF